ncbi:hypothetical protein EKH55_2222 [Sinorhizobium alkalisoli]|nr:hypothetical protein EKH55_2222 [Sinorhizobium alkalisoli]
MLIKRCDETYVTVVAPLTTKMRWLESRFFEGRGVALATCFII